MHTGVKIWWLCISICSQPGRVHYMSTHKSSGSCHGKMKVFSHDMIQNSVCFHAMNFTWLCELQYPQDIYMATFLNFLSALCSCCGHMMWAPCLLNGQKPWLALIPCNQITYMATPLDAARLQVPHASVPTLTGNAAQHARRSSRSMQYHILEHSSRIPGCVCIQHMLDAARLQVPQAAVPILAGNAAQCAPWRHSHVHQGNLPCQLQHTKPRLPVAVLSKMDLRYGLHTNCQFILRPICYTTSQLLSSANWI
jgi:hypothetical protein